MSTDLGRLQPDPYPLRWGLQRKPEEGPSSMLPQYAVPLALLTVMGACFAVLAIAVPREVLERIGR